MRIAMGYRTSMKGWDTCLTLQCLLVNVLTPRLMVINWTVSKQSARGYCCAKVIVIKVRWRWVNIFCLCCTTRRAHHITSETNFEEVILQTIKMSWYLYLSPHSIVVIAFACHAGDRGSIPRPFTFKVNFSCQLLLLFLLCRHQTFLCELQPLKSPSILAPQNEIEQ